MKDNRFIITLKFIFYFLKLDDKLKKKLRTILLYYWVKKSNILSLSIIHTYTPKFHLHSYSDSNSNNHVF